MLQMQFQMECTGRTWCDFVSFNPSFPEHLKMQVTRVDADPKLQSELREKVSDFVQQVQVKLAELEARA